MSKSPVSIIPRAPSLDASIEYFEQCVRRLRRLRMKPVRVSVFTQREAKFYLNRGYRLVPTESVLPYVLEPET